ncbi:MAG: AAA family ATPase [Myxococcota bacterium]
MSAPQPWFPFTPQPPHWTVDWPAINATFDWVQAMAGCPQDPIHHAEGDVWIHTRMVCEALATMGTWRALHPVDRSTIFAAALLHDVSKPETTRIEDDGRITARHHSPKGAIRARGMLWRMGIGSDLREQVCGLVRWHQVPYFCIEQTDPQALLIKTSQVALSRHLAILCEADARGRICADPQRLLDNIALFQALAEDTNCLDRPYRFPNDHARVLWFASPQRDPAYTAYDDTRCEVTLMSGLPGSGKDTWLRAHRPELPVISLDGIRRELGVRPTGNQGRVIQLAKKRAKEFLRSGQDFAWNATNLHLEVRRPLLGLFRDYNARVHIVAVEATAERQRSQNASRTGRARVPDAVIARMVRKWQAPGRHEAHRLTWTDRL